MVERSVTRFFFPVVVMCIVVGCSHSHVQKTQIPTSNPSDVLDAIAERMTILDLPPFDPSTCRRIRELYAIRPTLVSEILVAIEDPSRDHTKRLIAIKALGALGEPASPAVPRLAEIASGRREMPLNDKDRAYVTATLQVAEPALKPGQWWKSAGLSALIGIGRPAVPALEKMLQSPDPREASAAASALGLMGASGSRAVPILLKRLSTTDDPSEFIDLATTIESIDRSKLKNKQFASKVLGIAQDAPTLNDAMYAVHLLPIVGCKAEDAVPATVHVMARAIHEQGDKIGLAGITFFQTVSFYRNASVAPILDASHSQDPEVRAAGIYLLAADRVWSERCRPTVLQALNDSDPHVVKAAEQVLQRAGGATR